MSGLKQYGFIYYSDIAYIIMPGQFYFYIPGPIFNYSVGLMRMLENYELLQSNTKYVSGEGY